MQDTNGVITLMHKNRVILKFNFERRQLGYAYSFLPYAAKNSLPIGVVDEDTLETWLMERVIPLSREHIDMVLESLGVSDKDYLSFLRICRGLSLNDSYWLKDSNDVVTWQDINLYMNDFKDALMYVTFFGESSHLGGKLVTPELTTGGILGKCWRRVDGKVYMYKKGSSGYANAGKEVFSEAVVSRLLEVINRVYPISYCQYELLHWEGVLCTRCELFCTEDISFVPMKTLLRTRLGNIPWTYQRLIDNFNILKQGVDDMMVVDYIIENKDRHHGNYGALYNLYIKDRFTFSPIFDNGASLMCYKMDDELESAITGSEIGAFEFSNHEQAKSVLDKRHKSWLPEIKKNIDFIVGDDLVQLANKHQTLITPDRVNAIKKLITHRCDVLQYMSTV